MSQSMLAIKTKLGSLSNSLTQYAVSRSISIETPISMSQFDFWLNGPPVGSCTCWTVVNEGAEIGKYTYNRCIDASDTLAVISNGSTQTICVTYGTTPSIGQGLLTIYECGNICTGNAECISC